MRRPRLFIIPIFAMMKRNLSILTLLFLSVVLTAQSEEKAKPRTIRQWNLSGDFIDEVTIPFDTVFSLFHRFRLADKYSSLNATLGNYGLPFYQINFFHRVTDPDKFLYSGYYPFMYLSLIHISEPTRLLSISYAVFCLQKKKIKKKIKLL